MRIWLDNDGCPRIVREIVFKAAQRRTLPVSVVANSYMHVPTGGLVTMIVVPGSFDAADDHIADHCSAGDLIITADIPLAARVVGKGATALSPRGELFDAKNVGEKLAVRNLMQELRSSGEVRGGPPPLGEADRKRFADGLDRLLTMLSKT